MGLFKGVGKVKAKVHGKQGKGSESLCGQRPGWQACRWPEAGQPESQECQNPESFVLSTYIVGGMRGEGVTY